MGEEIPSILIAVTMMLKVLFKGKIRQSKDTYCNPRVIKRFTNTNSRNKMEFKKNIQLDEEKKERKGGKEEGKKNRLDKQKKKQQDGS